MSEDQTLQITSDDDFIESLPNHFKRIPDDVESYVYNMGDDVAKDNITKLFVRTEDRELFKEEVAESTEGVNTLSNVSIDKENIFNIKSGKNNIASSTDDSNSMSVDNFSVSHGSFFYDHFIINNMTYQSSQKVQIVQTFSDDFLYSFGENPVQANFSGVLLNTDNHRWRDHWLYMYDELLNAHDSIKNNVEIYIMFEEIVWKGRILDTSFSEKARRSRGINFNFTFYIQDKIAIKEEPPHETHEAQVGKDGGQQLRNRVQDFKNINIDTTDLDAIDSAIRDQITTPDNIQKRSGEEDEMTELKKAVKAGDKDRVIEEISKREKNGNTENIETEMEDVINQSNSTGAEIKKNVKDAFDSSVNGHISELTNLIDGVITTLKSMDEIDIREEDGFKITQADPSKGFEGSDFESDTTFNKSNSTEKIDSLEKFMKDQSIKPTDEEKTTLAGIYAARSNGWLNDDFDIDGDNINLSGSYSKYIKSDDLKKPGLSVSLIESSINEADFYKRLVKSMNTYVGSNDIYSESNIKTDVKPDGEKTYDVKGDKLKIYSSKIENSLYPFSIRIPESERDKITEAGYYVENPGDPESNKIKVEKMAENGPFETNFKADSPSWPHKLEINVFDSGTDSTLTKNVDVKITVKFYKLYNGGDFSGNITSKISTVRDQVKAVTHEDLDGNDKLEDDYKLDPEGDLANWFNGEDA